MSKDIKKQRFSFRELEHIACNFAINCLKGYQGSFNDYMNGVNKDWRADLKRLDKQETNIKDFHRMVTSPTLLCKDTLISKTNSNDGECKDRQISKTNSNDGECNCGQPSCSFGCA